MKLELALVAVLCISMPAAWAHTTVTVEQYSIEVGWGLEPPVVGVRNTFVFHVTEPGEISGVTTGIVDAFRDLKVVANYGGLTKVLDINSEPRPGYYSADVIPTKTGSMAIDITGTLNGVDTDVLVPIEDVESTALLDFPPREGSSQDVEVLKAAITSMQADIANIGTVQPDRSEDLAYSLAIVGTSLGVTAVVLSVLSLVRRPALR